MYALAHQIHREVLSANNIVLVPHQHPDADTLGSAVAFLLYSHRLGKNAQLYCSTPVDSYLHFLPEIENICIDPSILHRTSLIGVFDASDLRYAQIHEHLPATVHRPKIINFDHHHTNERFGDYNFVLTEEASTTSVLYKYFAHVGFAIDAPMATCLLAGLITDTGHFNHPNTNAAALKLGAALLQHGADFNLVMKRTVKNKTLNSLKLYGRVFNRLQKHPDLDLVYTVVRRADLTECGVGDDDATDVANFLNVLGEEALCLVIKETDDGLLKGSMRTGREDVDVSAVARALGGGGHKKAAGFKVPGTLTADGALPPEFFSHPAWKILLKHDTIISK